MKGDHGNMKEPFGGSGKLFCDTTPSPPSPPLTMNNDLFLKQISVFRCNHIWRACVQTRRKLVSICHLQPQQKPFILLSTKNQWCLVDWEIDDNLIIQFIIKLYLY